MPCSFCRCSRRRTAPGMAIYVGQRDSLAAAAAAAPSVAASSRRGGGAGSGRLRARACGKLSCTRRFVHFASRELWGHARTRARKQNENRRRLSLRGRSGADGQLWRRRLIVGVRRTKSRTEFRVRSSPKRTPPARRAPKAVIHAASPPRPRCIRTPLSLTAANRNTIAPPAPPSSLKRHTPALSFFRNAVRFSHPSSRGHEPSRTPRPR